MKLIGQDMLFLNCYGEEECLFTEEYFCSQKLFVRIIYIFGLLSILFIHRHRRFFHLKHRKMEDRKMKYHYINL